MTLTANLRRQHDAVLNLIEEIVAASDRLGDGPDGLDPGCPSEIGLMLARMTGILRIHFAQEDRLLYPGLMRSGDIETANTATRFFDEMGDLGQVYADFAGRWTMAAIRSDPRKFREESQGVFTVLGERIARENEQLYPLAERGADAVTEANRAA